MFSWIRVTLVMVIDRKLATKNNNRNKYPQNITRVSMFDSAFGSRFLLQHDVRSIFDSRLVVGWVRPRRASHDFVFVFLLCSTKNHTEHQSPVYTHIHSTFGLCHQFIYMNFLQLHIAAKDLMVRPIKRWPF